jgi:hypothetical protein
MRSSNSVLKEYVSSLSYKELLFIKTRFSQRVGGDLGEAVNFISKNEEMDKWLLSAEGAEDFYQMIDVLSVEVGMALSRLKRTQSSKRS